MIGTDHWLFDLAVAPGNTCVDSDINITFVYKTLIKPNQFNQPIILGYLATLKSPDPSYNLFLFFIVLSRILSNVWKWMWSLLVQKKTASLSDAADRHKWSDMGIAPINGFT